VGKGGFSQSRRAEKQNMIEGFAPLFSRLHRDLDAVLELLLADEVAQKSRPQAVLKSDLVLPVGGIHDALFGLHPKCLAS